MPAKEKHCDVVIPVQEDERLLAEHDKNRVQKLGNFGENEEQNPERHGSTTIVQCGRSAHRVVHTAAVDSVDKEGHRPEGADGAEHGQP